MKKSFLVLRVTVLFLAAAWSSPGFAYLNDRCILAAGEMSLSCTLSDFSATKYKDMQGTLLLVHGLVAQRPGGSSCEFNGKTDFFAEFTISGSISSPTPSGGAQTEVEASDAFAGQDIGGFVYQESELSYDQLTQSYEVQLVQDGNANIALTQIQKLKILGIGSSIQIIHFDVDGLPVSAKLICGQIDRFTVR